MENKQPTFLTTARFKGTTIQPPETTVIGKLTYLGDLTNDARIEVDGVPYAVSSKSLRLSTGLLDKNGVEIFEGDAAQWMMEDIMYQSVTIAWSESRAAFVVQLAGRESIDLHILHTDIEVTQ